MTAGRYLAAEHDGRRYMTTAVPLVGHQADDAEWLAARRKGIGASEIGSIAGVPGAFSSPFALWWSKRLGWETERTFAMKVGTALEPVIGQLFAEEYPGVILVRPAARLYHHPLHTWMLASPDFFAVVICEVCAGTGFVPQGDRPIRHSSEVLIYADPPVVKCDNCNGEGGWIEPVETKSDEGRGWKGEPPPKHLMQLWQQIEVFGAPRGHLVRLSGKRLDAYLVDPDGSARETILTAGAWFADCLATGTPPALDGHDATEKALMRLYPPGNYADDDPHAEMPLPVDLIGEFMAAHQARERANARFNVARNQVRAAMTDARWATDAVGNRVIEHRKYKKGGYEVGPQEIDEIRKAW